MSDKENDCPSTNSNDAFKAALGSSFGKRKGRGASGLSRSQLISHQSRNGVDRSTLPQLQPRPLKHGIRPDTRSAGSRRLRRKTVDHDDNCFDMGHFADLGSMLYAPEPVQQPSEDTLWARGRSALFEQRLRSEPGRYDRLLHMEQCRIEYCVKQFHSIPYVRCARCSEDTQAVVIITSCATIKVQIPFLACAGCGHTCFCLLRWYYLVTTHHQCARTAPVNVACNHGTAMSAFAIRRFKVKTFAGVVAASQLSHTCTAASLQLL